VPPEPKFPKGRSRPAKEAFAADAADSGPRRAGGNPSRAEAATQKPGPKMKPGAAEALEKLQTVKGQVRKRELLELTRSRVNYEKGDRKGEGGPELEGESPDLSAEARYRARALAAKKRGGAVDSGDDYEPDESDLNAWSQSLDGRRDKGSDDVRTAFSIKVADIRRLGPECFLGGSGPVDGGKLLYDAAGKVNLHFLLATYHVAGHRKQDEDEDDNENLSDTDRAYLKWLVRQAMELRLVNKRELRNGKITAKRMESMRKTGRTSLTLKENLVDNSDSEEELGQSFAVEKLSFSFPERRNPTETRRTDAAADKSRLRRQVSIRQTEIAVSTSHNVDIRAVQEKLLAPSLSFDWEDKIGDEDDFLEVEVPDEERGKDNKREMFNQQLRRSVSFMQAKQLAPISRSTSSVEGTPGAFGGSRAASGEQPRSVDEHPTVPEDTAAPESGGNAKADTAAEHGDEWPEDLDFEDTAATGPGNNSKSDTAVEHGDDWPDDLDLEDDVLAAVGTAAAVGAVSSSAAQDVADSEARGQADHEDVGLGLAEAAETGETTAAVGAGPASNERNVEGTADGEATRPSEASGERAVGAMDAFEARTEAGAPEAVTPVIAPAAGGGATPAAADDAPAARGVAMADTLADEGAAKADVPAVGDVAMVDGAVGLDEEPQSWAEHSQNWLDDISPTAMWGRGAQRPAHDEALADSSRDDDCAQHCKGNGRIAGLDARGAPAVAAVPGAEISPTLPFVAKAWPEPSLPPAEISPTVPFAAHDVPAPTGPLAEISPTMPFAARELPEPTAPPAEISPTMPFVARERPEPTADPIEISPTMPFVVNQAPPSCEVSQTQPFGLGEHPAPAPEASDARAAGAVDALGLGAMQTSRGDPAASSTKARGPTQGAEDADVAPGQSAKRLKRSTQIAFEDFPENLDEGDTATQGDEALGDDASRFRMHQEREWLRHKRSIELKQSLAQQKLEKAAKTRKRALEKAKDLGAATMTKDERVRFESLVGKGDMGLGVGFGALGAGAGKTKLADAADEDADLFGGGLSKRPRSRSAIFGAAGGFA